MGDVLAIIMGKVGILATLVLSTNIFCIAFLAQYLYSRGLVGRCWMTALDVRGARRSKQQFFTSCIDW